MCTWLKKADVVTRDFFVNGKKHILNNWINELIKVINDTENATLLVPAENGDILEVVVRGGRISVNSINTEMKKTALLNENQFDKRNFIELKNYGNHLNSNKLGIGYPYPEQLKKKLKSIREGQIITFSNGMSFWCTENDGRYLTLQKVCGDITKGKPLYAILKTGKPFLLDFTDKSLQNLYGSIRVMDTDSITARLSSVNNARVMLDTFLKSLEKTIRIDLGPVPITVQKNLWGGGVKLVGEDNIVYETDQVMLMFAWMLTSPVLIDFIRKDASLEDRYNDNNFHEQMEKRLAEFDFDGVLNESAKYCLKNEGNLRIMYKAYMFNEKTYDFIATGYQFSVENGGVSVKKIEFDSNDITAKPVMQKTVNPGYFKKFCERKYASDFIYLPNKKRELLRKGLPE